jgi:hypothetical protein
MTPDDLRSAYAMVEIPEAVWDDLDARQFVHRTTAVMNDQGVVDLGAMAFREGARMALIEFRRRVEEAKRPRPETEQTKAVSSTAREA